MITSTLTIWCEGQTAEGHDCPAWTHLDGIETNKHRMRKQARRHGWTYRAKQDFCPRCSRPAPPKPSSSERTDRKRARRAEDRRFEKALAIAERRAQL